MDIDEMITIASAGNLEIITALVGAGADVGATNEKGMTALFVFFLLPLVQILTIVLSHYAASKGHVAVSGPPAIHSSESTASKGRTIAS